MGRWSEAPTSREQRRGGGRACGGVVCGVLGGVDGSEPRPAWTPLAREILLDEAAMLADCSIRFSLRWLRDPSFSMASKSSESYPSSSDDSSMMTRVRAAKGKAR